MSRNVLPVRFTRREVLRLSGTLMAEALVVACHPSRPADPSRPTVLTTAPPFRQQPATRGKQVFAHYFTWFARKEISGRWRHWNWDGPGVQHDPNIIIDGHEDVATVDLPLIGAYDSSSSAVQRYHLDLAEAVGVDAFTIDWYGPSEVEGDQPDDYVFINHNLKRMLQAASHHPVKICVCYEEKILFDPSSDEAKIQAGQRHFRYMADEFFSSPGYWRVADRPVVIIWGVNKLSSAAWKQILQVIEVHHPWILYSHYNHNPKYIDICDGFYPWMVFDLRTENLAKQRTTLDAFYYLAKHYLAEGKSTVLGGGVWPAFDDSGVSGWGLGTRLIQDPGDELYDLTWEYALKNQAEWLSITTWNDWNEGTNIEPGIKHGSKYLKQTARYIEQYKGIRLPSDIETVITRHLQHLKPAR